MRREAILGVGLLALGAAAAAAAPAARADYAVLRSGVRLHITGYQLAGDRMRLTITGGTVDVAATDIAAIEPEENFTPNPPPAPRTEPITYGPYGKLIHDAAAKHGVDEDLIKGVIAAESNFNPRAISRKQALGLMQLLPETAARYSVANIFDPAQNIEAGTHYLKDLLAQYRGNLPLALAAYNAGPEMVDRYGGIPPFRETQSYVRRITTTLAKNQKASNAAAGTKTSSAGVHVPGGAGTAQGNNSRAVTTVGTTAAAAGAVSGTASPATSGSALD
jgi:soluble lytic murein transglycosylase-like protein